MKKTWASPKVGDGRSAKRRRLWVGTALGCLVGTLLTYAIEVAEPPLPAKPSKPHVAPVPAAQPVIPSAEAKPGPDEDAKEKTVFNPGKIVAPKPVKPVDLGGVMVRTFGALLLVLALFFGGVWVFRRSKLFSGYQGSGSHLNILESKSLGTRHSLHVISYGDQRFLIADSPAGTRFLTSLQELPGEDENSTTNPGATQQPYADFAARLRTLMNRNA